mgnify:CR=1 FL=1
MEGIRKRMKTILCTLLPLLPVLCTGVRWIGIRKGGCNSIDEIMGKQVQAYSSEQIANDCYVFFDSPDVGGAFTKAFDYLEKDQEVSSDGAPSSWGLDRIDQETLPLDKKTFSSGYSGEGVDIYIVDTGVYRDHEDFSKRNVREVFMISEKGDMNGHGTHCSGTALGNKHGVARKADLTSVKVLNVLGSGYISDVIKGISWIVNDKDKNPKKGVISMSLGSSENQALNRASTGASDSGFIVVVAAGNNRGDACFRSPAGAGGKGDEGGVITAGSSTEDDLVSSFSNYGQCVDLHAPGSSIVSASNRGPKEERALSGTSMSAPHIAGVAATLLEKHNHVKSKAVKELFDIATSGELANVHPNTPNLLLRTTDKSHGSPPTVEPSFCELFQKRRKCNGKGKCTWRINPNTDKGVCLEKKDRTLFPTMAPTMAPTPPPSVCNQCRICGNE